MKTYCKPAEVDIEDFNFIRPAVHRCFIGKLNKRKFQALLVGTGVITMEQLREDRKNLDMNRINDAIDAVAEWAVQRIKARDLQLNPVWQFTRRDGNSGKIRDLCMETPEQQVFEYIAKYALDPLFRAKILHCQYGSIPDRGQTGSKRQIEKTVRKKLRGKLDAVQCDVRKAYPSTKIDTIMQLLERDIGKNKTLLWFVRAVMDNYPGGVLLIGGYLSCWLYNYVMSYVLRHLMGQFKLRRGKRLPMVNAIVNYADDFIAFGQISNLTRAIKKTTRWAKETLGLTIKPAWKVHHLESFNAERQRKKARKKGDLKRSPGIDMVGYVVRRTYTIVRGNTFIHFRRQFIRAWRELRLLGYVPWWRAQTLIAEWGWIKHSNCSRFCDKYHVYEIINAAKKSVSWHARKVGTYDYNGTLYAVPCGVCSVPS